MNVKAIEINGCRGRFGAERNPVRRPFHQCTIGTKLLAAYLSILFTLMIVQPSYAMQDKNMGGLAMHLGFGSMYGGSGLCIEYQILTGSDRRITPFVSGGSTVSIYTV